MTLQRGDFAEFFGAARPGQRPFAWQERLLDDLLEHGTWPDRIMAPTGTGKTAVVDVHVFANALVGWAAAPRLPRRLSVVVDRRAVVDSHDEHARRIRDLLAEGPQGVLAEVAEGLRRLRPLPDRAGKPLLTARLRGGSPPPRSWRDAPEACQVLVATPDMWGSRLLLSGYGSSRRSWPREAGLLAYDNALVVDEAHLSHQLLHTARRVSELLHACAEPLPVPGLQVVETTATPAAGASGRSVGVEPTDLDGDPVLANRLTRPKTLTLLPVARQHVIARLADAVERIRGDTDGTVGCVVNRVATAIDVAGLLAARGLRVQTLVGRLRPVDVARLPEGLLTVRGAPAVDVLVATQTVEVGVDLDLAGMVTELASGSALAQRAGRVNRLGLRAEAPFVVLVPEEPVAERADLAPYVAADLAASLRWLEALAESPAGMAPWRLRDHSPPEPTRRRTLLQRPELADSWQWASTSDEVFAAADRQLWLADDLEPDLDVGIVVRSGLPVDAADGLRLLRACPPRPHETFPVSLRTATERLADLPGTGGGYLSRGTEITAWNGDPLRPGDLVVVPAATQLLRGGVVTANGSECADDVYEEDARSATVRLGTASRLASTTGGDDPVSALLRRLLKDASKVDGWTRADKRVLADDLAELASMVADQPVAPVLARAVRLLRDAPARQGEVICLDLDGGGVHLVVADRRRAIADEDLRQTWTTHDDPVPLERHQRAVADRARSSAEALGLSVGLVAALEAAGLHHDDGKADPRFQAMLGRDQTDLAKSARTARAAREAEAGSQLPLGWRHEQLSAVIAHAALEGTPEQLLATRLAGTTHGHGRSGFPHSVQGLLPAGHAHAERARRLFDVGDWDALVEATDATHGVWGCAYLEALLRAADGRVSGEGS